MTKRSGRPRLGEVPASTTISVRCTPAQRLELRRVASENGSPVAGVIRQAVDSFCDDCRDRRVFRRTFT